MRTAVEWTNGRSVADVRRAEVAQLLDALDELQRDGVVDARVCRSKRRALTTKPSR